MCTYILHVKGRKLKGWLATEEIAGASRDLHTPESNDGKFSKNGHAGKLVGQLNDATQEH